jgi:hypothetical protein
MYEESAKEVQVIQRQANDTDQASALEVGYGLKKLADGVNPTFESASQDIAAMSNC